MLSEPLSRSSPLADKLTFISEHDVATLKLTANECYESMRAVFKAHGDKKTIALPATHLDISAGRGFRSLCAAWPERGVAGNKWFGVRPADPGKPGQGVQALYILNDFQTGMPLAVISSNHLTGLRTAAMSLLVLNELYPEGPVDIGFIGCGLQAAIHLKMMNSLFKSINNISCFSRSRESSENLASLANELGIQSDISESYDQVISSAQVVISSVPLSDNLVPFLDPGLVRKGSSVIAVDLARSWQTDSFKFFDLKITDDHIQQSELPPISNTLGPLGTFDADLSDLIAGNIKKFDSENDRALFAFRGFSLADLAIANLIFMKSKELGAGTLLMR